MKNFFKKILELITRPEMKVLPGQLAFFIILAIFPLLTLIGYIGSNISLFSTAFVSALNDFLPSDVAEIILPFVTESQITGNIAFFMIVGFILVSNGTNSLIIASNELFGITGDDVLKRRIKAFFMIILLMALFIGFVDALPILGSGTVMIPWAIICAVNGDINLGIAIIVLLIIMSIARQVLEPKLVSKNIGVHPIFTLIAMYTGFKFIGIIGLLIGPIVLIIIKNIFASLIDQGVFKSIFERN